MDQVALDEVDVRLRRRDSRRSADPPRRDRRVAEQAPAEDSGSVSMKTRVRVPVERMFPETNPVNPSQTLTSFDKSEQTLKKQLKL